MDAVFASTCGFVWVRGWCFPFTRLEQLVHRPARSPQLPQILRRHLRIGIVQFGTCFPGAAMRVRPRAVAGSKLTENGK